MKMKVFGIFFLLSLLDSSTEGFVPVSSRISWTKHVNSKGKSSVVSEMPMMFGTDMTDLDPSQIVQQLSGIDWEQIVASRPDINDVVTTLSTAYVDVPRAIDPAILLFPMVTALAAGLYALSLPDDSFRTGYEPYGRGNYSPEGARKFYSKHPILVLRRALQLWRVSNRFIINYVMDKYVFRIEESNRSKRAEELLELINKAGPTAIKVGQAMSVREDMIPREYITALQTLQDRVLPFPSDQAKALLLKELGEEKFEKLEDIDFDSGPIASASIGQVYRASIDGHPVAVKCQRPDVLAEIGLDLFLVRELAPLYKRISNSATDFQVLANEWGRGFITELDYRIEARNTIQFNKDMRDRKMNNVFAPNVLEEFSTEKILVTDWVDGVRIDQSTAGDVPRLCSLALNAYLVMLLETRHLHCDPHPGNILRTSDGKLCILDFGMTLETDTKLQYALLEFVAHLTGEDYEKVPDDLVKLGFLREDRLEDVQKSGFLESLVYMLKQAGKGGGADKVKARILSDLRQQYPGMNDEELQVQLQKDVKKVFEDTRRSESAVSEITSEVEELQKRNQDAFLIPEWFVYTSRAFLTLEGVSLNADENYSIIKSCFPYVAKRLLHDDSPRAQTALRDMLYGAGDFLDTKRLTDLADGFAKYTTSTKIIEEVDTEELEASYTNRVVRGGQLRRLRKSEAETAVTLAKDSADIILSPAGNLLQDLLLEETALAASAQVKDLIRGTLLEAPQRVKDAIPLGFGSLLPRAPFADQLKPFLKKTDNESKAQSLLNQFNSLLPQLQVPLMPLSSDPESEEALIDALTVQLESLGELQPEEAAYIAKEFRENAPKYGPLLMRVGHKFASVLLKKASSNIDSTLEILDCKSGGADIVTAAAKGISGLASRGASAIDEELKE